MALNPDLVPMLWPSGPLEFARREKAKTLTPRSKEALQGWHNPASLELLRGAPVTCLVVTWAAGLPQDAEQQKTLVPLLERGKRSGLSFVGLVESGANLESATAAARTAGLSALLAAGLDSKEFPLISAASRSKLKWDEPGPVTAIEENVWPGVKASEEELDQAVSSATGLPWIDSNGWYVRLARCKSDAKRFWLLMEPPATNQNVVRPESYTLAVLDSEAHGAHWVVSLDDGLRVGLLQKNPNAQDAWAGITRPATLFATHKEWATYRETGALAVVSDFQGPDEFMGGELLNLLARNQMPYCAIDKARAASVSLASYKGMILMDEEPPSKELRQRALSFAQDGGLLIVRKSWGTVGAPGRESHPRFEIRLLGKGRVAVSSEGSPDPYVVAGDASDLLGRANDVLRVFNFGASMSSYYAVSTDGRKALFQIIDYSTRGADTEVTLWFREPYRSARLWTLGGKGPVPLEISARSGGVETYLPAGPSYAAVELQR